MLKSDICIIGAGPGGAAAALQLAYHGVACTLIDKATFPRDKICGDALSGKVSTVLNRMDPAIMDRLRASQKQANMWGLKFTVPNMEALELELDRSLAKELVAPGYVVKRLDFDNFLIEETKRHDSIQLIEGIAITDYEKTDSGYLISNKDKSFQLSAKLLIIANGAHSSFSRHHAGLPRELKHHAGGVRAYYKNVGGLNENSYAIELHYMKELIPGYLWIFPLPHGEANVGLAMRSDKISERTYNLKQNLQRILTENPSFKDRFAEAELVDEIRGFGLPMGSKKRKLSGDHYMLVGDAGHLIDPLTGEGIGNAIFSGVVAADQAMACLQADDFSASFMRAYDKRIRRVMGRELQLGYVFQRMMFYPGLIRFLMKRVYNNHFVMNFLQEVYADSQKNWVKQVKRPGFWWKVVFPPNKKADSLS